MVVHWGLRWVLNKNDVKLGPEVGDVYFRFRDVIEDTYGENFLWLFTWWDVGSMFLSRYQHSELTNLLDSSEDFYQMVQRYLFLPYFGWPSFKGIKNFYVLYITLAVIFPWLGRCWGWKNPQEEGKVGEESFTRKVCQDKN